MTINSLPELNLVSGWMNAAGTLGFTPVTEQNLPDPPVAFVTNPISHQPRKPASDRFCEPYSGGFLLHTGWPNPGFRKVLKQASSRWARAERPIWVHLLAEEPHELDRMVRVLEETEGVAVIEISLPLIARVDLRLQLVDAGSGELPLVVCVPLDQVNADWVGAVVDVGVSGLVISAPHGMLRNATDGYLRGRMFGPGLLPQLLQALACLRSFEIPLIAGCGIFDPAAMETALSAGAAAVQLDAVLWRGWVEEKLD
jgi:dihydroorotate dehydrogenase (NAD+) catalytic subunit